MTDLIPPRPPLPDVEPDHEMVKGSPPVQNWTPRKTSFTADELMAMTFPEPRWAVDGVLPEGLTVFAGAPKVGKSWLALNLAVSVATGGQALGKIPVTAGDALYLALEDTPRRLQQRLGMVLDGPRARLTVETECEPLPAGGIARIAGWLEEHPDARLVIVDVFAKVRPVTSDKSDRYLADYNAVTPLKVLADEYGVAVLLLHHTRKAASDDFLDTISGTQGIAGAADTVLVLKRSRTAADAVLSVTGRDVDESEHALTFDAELGTWRLLGDAQTYAMSPERRAIVKAVEDAGSLRPKQIAEKADLDYDVVKHLVRKMVDAGQIDTDGSGTYLPHTPIHPVHSVHHDGDGSERGERSEQTQVFGDDVGGGHE